MKLYNDKCENVLPTLEADSIDAMVTDPPAGIAFMGKDWDKDHGGRDNWIAYMTGIFEQCLRVLKPGAHGLVWVLPRTSHWTATALEDAGFEIRDIVNHIFGSGFPKSLAIGKAIDKIAGAKREIVGREPISYPDSERWGHPLDSRKGKHGNITSYSIGNEELLPGRPVTLPITDDAKQWEGWGTALKPACEHWILVRKPLAEKTVAANVLAYGVGGINVDGCRIGTGDDKIKGGCINRKEKPDSAVKWGIGNQEIKDRCYSQGRFPANVILDDSEVVRAGFPSPHGAGFAQSKQNKWGYNLDNTNTYGKGYIKAAGARIGDNGSAARFFYCAKASKRDRDEGCEVLGKLELISTVRGEEWHPEGKSNSHPTVKSTELMRYLCRLITPPDGTIIDPFMGSGSTGKGAILEEFDFIGIEQEIEYFKIAEARINFVLNKTDDQLRMAI